MDWGSGSRLHFICRSGVFWICRLTSLNVITPGTVSDFGGLSPAADGMLHLVDEEIVCYSNPTIFASIHARSICLPSH